MWVSGRYAVVEIEEVLFGGEKELLFGGEKDLFGEENESLFGGRLTL